MGDHKEIVGLHRRGFHQCSSEMLAPGAGPGGWIVPGVRLKVKGGSNWTCPWCFKPLAGCGGAVFWSPLVQRLRELQIGR